MNPSDSLSRRSVIQGLASLGALGALGVSRSAAQDVAAPKAPTPFSPPSGLATGSLNGLSRQKQIPSNWPPAL